MPSLSTVTPGDFSRTSKAFISIKLTGEKVLEIRVRDFGKGFEVKAATEAGHHDHGFGLYNLIERVRLMQGQIEVDSKPAQGTTIEVKIPPK